MAVPTDILVQATSFLLATDPETLAPATGACKVHLIAAPFSPGAGTRIDTLAQATFTGSAAKAGAAGPQTEGRDPNTGRRKIVLGEPAGGWTWLCTADPASPETIHGYVLTDGAGTVTLASLLLPQPVTVARVGDLVSIGEVSLLLANVPWE
jgi:hypothetical protein